MRLGFVTFGIAVLAGVVWYTSSSRVKQPELGHRFAPLLTVDGSQFKDLDRNGKLYEIKLDDYRALAVNSDGKLSFYSRRRQIALAFGVAIDKDVVRRILSVHYWPESDSGGPCPIGRFY